MNKEYHIPMYLKNATYIDLKPIPRMTLIFDIWYYTNDYPIPVDSKQVEFTTWSDGTECLKIKNLEFNCSESIPFRAIEKIGIRFGDHPIKAKRLVGYNRRIPELNEEIRKLEGRN